MSYDFDGDGYVDNLELFIGCRLDTNKDGRIDTAERKQAKALLEEMQANYTFGLDVRVTCWVWRAGCALDVRRATHQAGRVVSTNRLLDQ